MRAGEFLLEYNREITAQRIGSQLAGMFRKEGPRTRRVMGRDITEKDSDQDIIEALIRMLEQSDPTANKQYVPWMARTYARGGMNFEDVLSQVSEYLSKFHKLNLQRKLPVPRNDILRYQDFGDFFSVMDEYPDPEPTQLKDRGQASELYDDKNIRVIIPENQAAACYYGQGARWCTAATKGKNYFNDYADLSPLMIVVPKQPAYPGEKYQLWFFYGVDDRLFTSIDDYLEVYHTVGEDYLIDNEQSGQFMNEKDQPVKLKSLMNRFGNSLQLAVTALEQRYPHLGYAIKSNYENDY